MSAEFAAMNDRIPDRLSLVEHEVHVWAVDRTNAAALKPALQPILSRAEIERARRYHFDHDRDRFIASRAALRLLLARYTGRPPNALEFGYSPQGKPNLAAAAITFNAAHRSNMSLFAIGAAVPVGVDIEWIVPPLDYRALIAENASDTERAAFDGLAEEDLINSFFCWWTRKEAVVKALGHGLSAPLHDFAVSIAEHQPEILWSRLESLGSDWSLIHLRPADDYVGCLAIAGQGICVSARRAKSLAALIG